MHIIKETAHLEQWAVKVSYLDGTSDLTVCLVQFAQGTMGLRWRTSWPIRAHYLTYKNNSKISGCDRSLGLTDASP